MKKFLDWLRVALFRSLRGALESFVDDALDIALKEVHEDIEAHFTAEQQEVLKSGTFLLKQRLGIVLREKLEGIR